MINSLYSFIREFVLFSMQKIRDNTVSLIRDFNFLRKSPFEKFQDESLESSYIHFKKYFKNSIFLKDFRIKTYAISKALEVNTKNEGLFIEFGVHKGKSINFFSKIIKNNLIYGFDSFEGLREDWKGTQAQKGTFNLKGIIPPLRKNVIPVKGWIQDTLPKFIKEKDQDKINFVHIDVDTYETSHFILKTIKPFLNKDAIILFDELYNCIGWEENEYKSLTEIFNENEYNYLAFSKEGSQVIIQIK